jgi:CheY-like chemotaxis protein
MVATGAITEEELREALRRHEATGNPLGQILVAMGAATENQLEHALKVQSRLRGRSDAKRSFILVVDDDPEVGAILADILEGAGFCVGVAEDTTEAGVVLLAPDGPNPSAAVLDLGLPGDGGVDLLARLRDNEKTCSLPVVILTGRPDLAERIQERGLTISALLAKPVPARQLIEVVEAAARQMNSAASVPSS